MSSVSVPLSILPLPKNMWSPTSWSTRCDIFAWPWDCIILMTASLLLKSLNLMHLPLNVRSVDIARASSRSSASAATTMACNITSMNLIKTKRNCFEKHMEVLAQF